jgi:hypothetical protein
MKTLTIRIPDSLLAELEYESRARNVSKSDIVRERLDHPDVPRTGASKLRSILETAWAAEVPERPRRFRSSKKQKLAEIIRAKKLHR